MLTIRGNRVEHEQHRIQYQAPNSEEAAPDVLRD